MGKATFKPNPDKDFYVVMSSITDLPVCWGTAEDLLKWYVAEQFAPQYQRDSAIFGSNYAEDLKRADEYGTSSRIGRNDDTLMWGGVGSIKVSDLEHITPLLENLKWHKWTTNKKVLAYVEKFDYDD